MNNKVFIIPLFLLGICISISGQEILRFVCADGSASRAFIPLIEAIYEELQIPITIEFLPAERALLLENDGLYDGDVARTDGSIEDFSNLMYTGEYLGILNLKAVVKKGIPIILHAPEDLKNYRVAHVRGLKLAEGFCSTYGITAEVVGSFESLAKMLELNRFDVAIAINPPPVLTQVGTVLDITLATARNYHVLHRKHAALADRFDRVLRAMKEDGRIAVLLGL